MGGGRLGPWLSNQELTSNTTVLAFTILPGCPWTIPEDILNDLESSSTDTTQSGGGRTDGSQNLQKPQPPAMGKRAMMAS